MAPDRERSRTPRPTCAPLTGRRAAGRAVGPSVRRAVAGLGAVALASAVACRTGRGPAAGLHDATPALFTESASPGTGRGAPTVVFLPGYGATTGYYRDRVTPVARAYGAMFVDLLGFGRSPMPGGTYSVDRHVLALRRTLADRGPLVLVGHSFGARLAVTYAARYPEDVRAVVLLALPYYPDDSGRERARAYFAARGGPGRALWTSRRATYLACVLGHGPLRWAAPHVAYDLPDDVRADGLAHTPVSATSTLHDALYGHDLGGDIARLRPDVPVTLVHGDRDRTALLSGALAFAERHATTTVRVLTGVDHHPLLRAPDLTLAAIDSALADAARR